MDTDANNHPESDPRQPGGGQTATAPALPKIEISYCDDVMGASKAAARVARRGANAMHHLILAVFREGFVGTPEQLHKRLAADGHEREFHSLRNRVYDLHRKAGLLVPVGVGPSKCGGIATVFRIATPAETEEVRLHGSRKFSRREAKTAKIARDKSAGDSANGVGGDR